MLTLIGVMFLVLTGLIVYRSLRAEDGWAYTPYWWVFYGSAAATAVCFAVGLTCLIFGV